jgi:hypothetical protein
VILSAGERETVRAAFPAAEANVSFWHFSDVPPAASEGRFWFESGLRQVTARHVYEFTL